MMDNGLNGGVRVGVVLEEEQNKILDRLVVKDGRSKSWMIRKAIDQYLRTLGIAKTGR